MSRSSAGGSYPIAPLWSDYADSLDQTRLAVDGYSVLRFNALASLRIRTSAGCTGLLVDLLCNQPAYAKGAWAVWIDGVYAGTLAVTAVDSVQSLPVALDGSSLHVVELISGDAAGGLQLTACLRVWGVGGNIALLGNPTAAKRIAGYGDSIMIGFGSTVPSTQGWIQLVRRQWSGRIACEAWDGRRINECVGNVAPIAARLVGLCFGADTRIVWDAMGLNDFGDNMTAATYGGILGSLYDAIHAADPGIRIMAQTLIRADPSYEITPNSSGALLSDFREAKAAVASARSGYVTLVDASTWTISLADGWHPNTVGNAQYASCAMQALASVGLA